MVMSNGIALNCHILQSTSRYFLHLLANSVCQQAACNSVLIDHYCNGRTCFMKFIVYRNGFGSVNLFKAEGSTVVHFFVIFPSHRKDYAVILNLGPILSLHI